MRLSPLVFGLAAVAVAAVLLFAGPCRSDPTGRQATADSLDARADSIAADARDSIAADSADSAETDRRTDSLDAISGSLADTLKDLDRVDSTLRARGPVRVARETRDMTPPRAAGAIALDTAPASPGFNPDDPTDQYVAEEEAYSACASTDDVCWAALDSIVKADSTPRTVGTLLTASDSIAWYQALDANNLARVGNLRSQLANEIAARKEVEADRARAWRRVRDLGRQVADLQSTTHAATDLVESPKLDLGIFEIPRPCVGAGPGGTLGLASNDKGTGFGGAVGISVAVVIPFSGGCGA